ncbi:hypothetical protein CONPUDRAFT_96820 [Coniophora puteana RWD-64-598 SS2]|uniref:Yeast cell wall synthesis Kre9/Knh1-like N-terminal domain-containing protein n=1 Tax=Coniophora puteana (strain RWD-64-598) TaxID=741705 RepID=A0A5M3N7H8_CONPW|nr:uncharacterized protein CONPUDRAFT_96820 [Coniophora puteana RWD-64-598 SS2]EIW87410.1 hypothetical protein CONPUDRAFT_96820 [Coniophora puteana RWD-64-598 SS2]
MFNKLAALALIAPLASALTLNTPTTSVTNGAQVTITWTATTEDPSTFSLELVNTVFHNAYALVSTVQTASGSATFELPTVPVGSGYSFEAIKIGDINTVYSNTPQFDIGQATASPSSTASVSSQTLPSSYNPTSTGSQLPRAAVPAALRAPRQAAPPRASTVAVPSVPSACTLPPSPRSSSRPLLVPPSSSKRLASRSISHRTDIWGSFL